jgi:hypothetical protein
MNKNTRDLLDASTEVDLEANLEKNKKILTPLYQNAGKT